MKGLAKVQVPPPKPMPTGDNTNNNMPHSPNASAIDESREVIKYLKKIEDRNPPPTVVRERIRTLRPVRPFRLMSVGLRQAAQTCE